MALLQGFKTMEEAFRERFGVGPEEQSVFSNQVRYDPFWSQWMQNVGDDYAIGPPPGLTQGTQYLMGPNNTPYMPYDPNYWTAANFYGKQDLLAPYEEAIRQQMVIGDGGGQWIPAELRQRAESAMQPLARGSGGGGGGLGGLLEKLFSPMIESGGIALPAALWGAGAFEGMGELGAAGGAAVAPTGYVDPWAAGVASDVATGGAAALPAGAAGGVAAGGAAGIDMGVGAPVGGMPTAAEAVAASGGAATAGGAAGGGIAAPVAGSAISRIIDGTATTNDWISVLGTAGATGLGMFSAGQQANTLSDIAERTRAERAPFLNKATEWLTNPEAYGAGPGQAAMKSTLAGLSAAYGNPIGSGTALQLATDAGLRDWRNAVTGMGNLGLAGQDLRASLETGAARSTGDIWSNLAGGISNIINPEKSLAELLKQYGLVIGGARV